MSTQESYEKNTFFRGLKEIKVDWEKVIGGGHKATPLSYIIIRWDDEAMGESDLAKSIYDIKLPPLFVMRYGETRALRGGEVGGKDAQRVINMVNGAWNSLNSEEKAKFFEGNSGTYTATNNPDRQGFGVGMSEATKNNHQYRYSQLKIVYAHAVYNNTNGERGIDKNTTNNIKKELDAHYKNT